MNDTVTEIEEDEYEDWQYEKSYVSAEEFISEGMFESLIEFDLNNDDEDYVPGTALYVMTHYCVDALIQACSFTKDDILHLVDEVFESINDSSEGHTLH